MEIDRLEIRPYRPDDRDGCRRLWVQLVEHHREIYDSQSIGGPDPAAEFDEYLARDDRVNTWVAVDADDVVGLTGLLWHDGESEIEPVIVDRKRRGAGIGRRLIETAIDDSRRRGARDVNIRPVARNASAIGAFHELGFRTLGHLQLFMRLDGASGFGPGPEIHGRRFDL